MSFRNLSEWNRIPVQPLWLNSRRSSILGSLRNTPIRFPVPEHHPNEVTQQDLASPGNLRAPRRRWKVPIILFALTCVSTFWVGSMNWQPLVMMDQVDGMYLRRLVLSHWDQGLLYMVCLMSILLAHEMGHFVTSLIYRVPQSAPIFLPYPLNPLGTLGAVIVMSGNSFDRKQIFDIGIAGPIAGMVIAVPLCLVGVQQLDLGIPEGGGMAVECPLLIQWMIESQNIPGYVAGEGIWLSQLNPYLAAAWAGFLVTGLNMMPVGQLDGGHITHALAASYANRIAQGVIVLAIAYMVYTGRYLLIVMVALLLLMGTRHPPTRDDHVQLGPFRYVLGIASFSMPILCFPPNIFLFDF